MKQRRWINNQ